MIKRIVVIIMLIVIALMPLRAMASVNISASGAVVMESSTHSVLWESNSNTRLPMASTTKVFTAYAIVNNCDLEDIVTIDSRAVGIEGSSIYLRVGQQLSVRDLLYGLMLRSGNDSAVALAIHCSGSVDNFCHLVNNMCRSLGLQDTNITNPHGLHEDNHYTTAHDLGIISSLAINNKYFREIVSAKHWTLHYANDNTTCVIANKNKLLNMYEGACGIKTGYTRIAGRCLVGSAEKDGMTLVTVVLNSPDMWKNTSTMLDYAYNNYTMTNIVSQNEIFIDTKSNYRYYYASSCYKYPINTHQDIVVDKRPIFEDEAYVELSINDRIVCNIPLVKIDASWCR